MPVFTGDVGEYGVKADIHNPLKLPAYNLITTSWVSFNYKSTGISAGT